MGHPDVGRPPCQFLASHLPMNRTKRCTLRAATPYSRQLIATEDIVIMMPAGVERQPLVSIMNEGQSMCLRFVCPNIRSPENPNHNKVRIPPETTSPHSPPKTSVVFMVTIASSHSPKSVYGRVPHFSRPLREVGTSGTASRAKRAERPTKLQPRSGDRS